MGKCCLGVSCASTTSTSLHGSLVQPVRSEAEPSVVSPSISVIPVLSVSTVSCASTVPVPSYSNVGPSLCPPSSSQMEVDTATPVQSLAQKRTRSRESLRGSLHQSEAISAC